MFKIHFQRLRIKIVIHFLAMMVDSQIAQIHGFDLYDADKEIQSYPNTLILFRNIL